MLLELSELIGETTETNEFVQIGSATAPNFEWQFPLVLSEHNFDCEYALVLSERIQEEQLSEIEDVAGPFEQSYAFATIVPAA